MGRNTYVATATAAIAAVAIAAIGAMIGLLLAPEPVPVTALASEGQESIAVATEEFDDLRNVAMSANRREGSVLEVVGSGRITRSKCAAGAEIKSGDSPLSVNGVPVVALGSDVPLWRDMKLGTRGKDVRSLQEELVRLGYPLRPDGHYGSATADALIDLRRDHGVERPSRTLSMSEVMWLPARAVTVGECRAPLGSSPVDGVFATTPPVLESLRITGDISRAVPGDRVVRSGELQAPVDDDGVVTDADFLAEVSASQEFRSILSEDGQDLGHMSFEYVLAEPLEVTAVPPAALYGIDGEHGCVTADEHERDVRIVASSLGLTRVVFDGGPPSTVDLDPAPGNTDAGCG